MSAFNRKELEQLMRAEEKGGYGKTYDNRSTGYVPGYVPKPVVNPCSWCGKTNAEASNIHTDCNTRKQKFRRAMRELK